ncbi:MAG: response regulator [Thermoplasmata archaeon]|nr:response regulator [Thermoplasmata archaeon]
MKILIVDDSEVFRKVVIEILIRSGFNDVTEASSYDEAVDLYRSTTPDIVFADMILPGKSGVELTKEILRINPTAKIIAMSSIVNKSMIKQSLDAGARDFLLKPTNEIALSSVLAMWSD